MANAGGEHQVIDIEALSSSIERGLSGNLAMPPQCSIFKIPTILSRHSKDAFTPNAFSFGPFHHDNVQLKPTNRIKQKYLLDLISRLSKPNPLDPNPTDVIRPDSKLIRNFTKAISDVQNEARDYYAGPIGMKADKFLEMLVLDGCFIIELFRKKSYPDLVEKGDPIFTMPCLFQFLYHDLILLENQIPWLVLEILFDLTNTRSIDTKLLVELAIDFFDGIFTTEKTPVQPLLSTNHGSKHILDLLRNSLVLNSGMNTKRASFNVLERMHSATRLEDSRIRFRTREISKSILDIRFLSKTGVMEIPTLLIQETTETVFRNLISLEQCCPGYEPIVTSYAVLLDNLINTNKDLQILCKSKTIISWLNIDDATKIFNKLYIDTYVKKNYYDQLTTEVNRYSKRRWPRYQRVLKRDYFKHPWSIIGFIAASIAFILAILGTLFDIINQ
ncbi:hypothetical protein TorRG33x02_088490 [Trema orientale]|uniref:Uncharacterized protein n=1 Tax=Trema orientale TaxID=63057 RepID=A0A2P5FBZ5_TREOI|nr:hypothetical protein TorRG33x02_088490 [Trema orientale]